MTEAELVRNLSVGEKAALKWLPEDGTFKEVTRSLNVVPPLLRLQERELAVRCHPNKLRNASWALTSRGQRVAALLGTGLEPDPGPRPRW
jgi:hypothetical protein